MSKKFHPKLKEDFFKVINTKEKAYWLGFLYADGYVETRNGVPYRIGIEIDKEEDFLIDRFIQSIGLNPKYKHYREDHNSVLIRFANKRIVNDLVKRGVIPGKSNLIKLPNLNSRELYLAFLLGFFDGDGKAGTTRIVSGSIKFLNQIKKKFKLSTKIYEKNSPGYLDNRLIAGHGYSMSLGVDLFRDMLLNFNNSLPRKRRLLTNEEKIERIKKSKNVQKKRKFLISKEELKDLVWKIPMKKIASKYQVSDKAVKYWCLKWDIGLPPLGYWGKKHS